MAVPRRWPANKARTTCARTRPVGAGATVGCLVIALSVKTQDDVLYTLAWIGLIAVYLGWLSWAHRNRPPTWTAFLMAALTLVVGGLIAFGWFKNL